MLDHGKRTVALWMQDELLRKVIRNGGKVFSGSVVAALLNLVAMVLMVRALGPTLYGALVLVITYTMIIDKLINFQSWQALIKFGADMSDRPERHEDFIALTSYCRMLDMFSAVAGTVIAILAIPYAAQWLDWDAQTQEIAHYYCLIILANLSGVPMAVLRLYDRFNILAWQQVMIALCRVAGAGLAYMLQPELWLFAAVWAMGEVVGNVYLLWQGERELRRHHYRKTWWAPVMQLRQRFPDLWHFIWTSNLLTSVRVATRELDIMFVGSVLGTGAAGMYHVVRQFASVPLRVVDPLTQSIYPELSKLSAAANAPALIRLLVRSALLTFVVGIVGWGVFVWQGEWIFTVTVGEAYLVAKPVLVHYMIGTILAITGFALQPAMLALGKTKQSLWCMVFTTLLYYTVLYLFLHNYGLIGAAYAYILFITTWITIMVWFLTPAIRHLGDIRERPSDHAS